jgi:ribosomal protein L21E
MKAKTIVLTLALCFVATAVCFASGAQVTSQAQMGTWKLNEAKSKLASGVAKNHTVVYEASGDDVKITVDGTFPDGQPAHNEWTGKFDGKYYPVTGDPASDERAYKVVNARTLLLTVKKGGKVTFTGRIVVSANGKTRTITTRGTDAQGKKFKGVGVYDKQ